MTTVRTDEGRYVYVPEGFEEPASTTLEGLKQGRALLAEEGRWIKYAGFQNPHPEEDPTTPFCDGWGACAIGALYCVNIGVDGVDCGVANCTQHKHWDAGSFGRNEAARRRYVTGVQYLNEGTRQVSTFRYSGVVEFNDHDETTHEQVMAVYDKAIDLCESYAEAVSNS